ncbi:response regulator [Paenibacillus thermoaerophilus]|uniref:Response regulator n=1 Tax=Paenibacillus thermoaerophilus TaxID=1215385 RepID=A0ABW2V3J8_9BACL|nr:response regulator [Paenibacillus thermoaerophilus]TMV12030.1 response regulator [Paenibacillus thermoaerophilus]
MVKAVIIDDDPATLNGLKKSINWKRFNIEVAGVAENGQEGLRLIEACQPDLILTDIYMPVIDGIEMLKRVRQQNVAAEVIILSGYEDFKYAQTALKLRVWDYISKPATIEEIEAVVQAAADHIRANARAAREEQELRELLEHNLPWAKKQLFKGLLEPGHVQPGYMKKVADYLRMNLHNRYFCVVVVEYLKSGERLASKQGEWLDLSSRVRQAAEEAIGTAQGIYIADIQLNMLALIVSAPAHGKPEAASRQARQIASEMIRRIELQCKLKVWAAIGSTVGSAEDIHLSYKEAMDIVYERLHLIDRKIITKDDIQVKPRAYPLRTIESCQRMVDAAMQGQSDWVEQKLQLFLADLEGRPNLTVERLREYAIEFTGVLLVALHDHGLQFDDLRTDFNPYAELDRICCVEDFASYARETLQAACQAMNRKASTKHKKTVDFIIRFVHDHYAEDITLDVIADKVYLTRNYLSQIFKQATGENYSSYLTRVRMEKAKELMRTGNYKLYEVASKVGYKNNAYFSQLFKKYTGMNPSEFNQ